MVLHCLKASNTLRKQMFSTFGVAALFSLMVVVVSACLSVYSAGEIVKEHSSDLMVSHVADALKTSSRSMAEKLSARLAEVDSSVQILVECLQDRIVGYPSMDGWQQGKFVPFIDSTTQTPKYPLAMPPVPLDWNISLRSSSILEDDALGERVRWYGNSSAEMKISTKTAAFHFQGACNPDSESLDWVEGCSDSHNNVTSGGVFRPTSTHLGLYQSTGDLSVFMKPLFESQEEVLQFKIYFLNDGAGATLAYPASRIPPSAETYTSLGCDWLSSINVRTGKPYGSTEFCHSEGETVQFRNYNPMEEAWAPFFLEPEDKVGSFGPLLDDPSVVKAGKAVYDRLTGSLIGFVTADIAVDSFSAAMNETASFSEFAEFFILKYEDGAALSSRVVSGHTHNFDPELLSQISASALNKSGEVIIHDGHIISAYPLPLPSEDYQGVYIPQYLVIHWIPCSAVPVKEEINKAIDKDVTNNVVTSIILGLAGSILVLAILSGVSAALTDPLLWIDDVARRILRDQKSQRRISLDGETSMTLQGIWRYAPKTEIFLLVKEFQNVLLGLSGEGVSKVASPTPVSVKNVLTYNYEFEQYYGISDSEKQLHPFDSNGRENSKSRYTQPTFEPSLEPPMSTASSRSIGKITKYPNAGPVVNQSLVTSKPVRQTQGSARIWHSSLFQWIVILIIVPLLLTNAILVTLVSKSITTSIPKWIRKAEAGSELIVKQNLLLIAATKASVISSVVGSGIRDLHFMTRVAGWLFFEGIRRSDGFTQGRSAAEECKSYIDSVCPFFPDPVRNPCSCDWDDPWDGKPWPGCFDYPNVSDTRFLQQFHFSVQSMDADNVTGNRFSSSSFPMFGNTSATTFWWTNASLVPGSRKGANATGYDTTYDRIRVSSAATSVYFPIYNYATSLGREKPILGTYIGFEKDGLLQGFDGCYGFHGEVAFARSNKNNRAAEIAPSLCPEGKYGYDPRCRDWYAAGKRMYDKSQIPVHVTSPYIYQLSQNTIATSATSPIANPKTGEYVGQVLLDFFSLGLLSSIKAVNQTLSFVITPEKDITGGDTVIGPNKLEGWRSVCICDVLFPNENVSVNEIYRQEFEYNAIRKMKGGESDIVQFTLVGEDGSTEEFYLAFAPVTYRLLLPTNPSEFSEGVTISKDLVYSVAIGESMSKIKAPFESAVEEMTEDLVRLRNIYISVIAAVTCLYIMFTIFVAILVTTPIITLLELVRDINKGIFSDDIPPLLGGCRESMRVFSIFSRLNKIVMVSNTAFFSHNVDRANHFLNTALHLFRKIDDEKAIGVASNNLANTLCAKLHESQTTKDSHDCGNPCMVKEALRHYDKAVNVSQKEFESAAVCDKARFAERLGDRLFNRGLFLVFCADYDCAPSDAKSRGYEDISRARIIHYEVKDYLLENKLLFEQAAPYWNRLIRRINCLLALYHDDGLRERWDAETLLDEADQLMMAAWQIPTAPLFRDVTPTGRRQQLEGSAILLCQQIGQHEQAFHLSMRMFAQDEYLLESSCVPAAESLLLIAESGEMQLSTKLQGELKQMLKNRSRSPMEFLTMEKF